jgi:hypothetical protein
MTAPRFGPDGDLPQFVPLGFMRGDDLIRTFGWTDEGGAVDLTGVRIVFRIGTDPATVLSTDVNGGITRLDQTGPLTRGMFEVAFTAALLATIPLEPATAYSIHAEVDGTVTPIGRGEIVIFKGGAT